MLFNELLLKAVWRLFEIESVFVLWGSCILSDIIKIAKQIFIYFAILVRFVQTYSVFKQIAKSICNEYSICFSSQKLPYSSASVFVYGVLRTLSQHNKNEEHSKEHSSFLVRWKGLEPPTYWFVAAWICIKYAENGCFKPFLLYKICPQVYLDLYN